LRGLALPRIPRVWPLQEQPLQDQPLQSLMFKENTAEAIAETH